MNDDQILALLDRMAELEALREMRAEMQAEQQPQQERGWGQAIYDNLIGDPSDGVTSYGEMAGSWLNRAAESASVGLLGDEANAAVTGLLPGRDYESELARYRQNEEDLGTMGRLSADIVGGVGGALAAGPSLIARIPSLAGRIGAAVGGGALAGGVHGFMEGEGDSVQRASSAVVPAIAGGAIGAAGMAIAPLAREAQAGLREWRRGGSIGRSVGGELGVSPQAASYITDRLAPEGADELVQTLRSGGPRAMVADVSPSAAGVLDVSIQAATPGAREAMERVQGRAGGAYEDVTRALMGGRDPQGLRTTLAQQSSSVRPILNEAYERAYSTPIDYSSEAGRRIEEILGRLPRSTAGRAIDAAQERMVYEGLPTSQILADIAEDGSVTFRELPNVMQLDYIKRAFDDIVRDSTDAFGRVNSTGRLARQVAREVREAAGDAVPAYREALSTAADSMATREAIETGAEALSPRTRVEDIRDMVSGATPAELSAMRDGLREQISHVMGNVRLAASDQTMDARQAAAQFSMLSSGNAREKLAMIFGDEFPEIERALREAGPALGLRADIATNSRTFGRGEIASDIREMATPGALRQGRIMDAGRDLIGRATGANQEAVRRASRDTMSELAELLTREGPEAERTLQAISRALAANPPLQNAGSQWHAIAQALGIGLAPAASGAYTNMRN